MFEEIGFWEALQLKIVTPLGLGGVRHVLSYSLGSVHSVFCNLELVQVLTLQFLSPGPAMQLGQLALPEAKALPP